MTQSLKVLPKVRTPKIDYSQTTSHYVLNNILGTHILNALQIIVPLGEDFFIRSVKPFIDKINPQLQKRTKKFIGQEVVHRNEHESFWRVLESQGYNIESFKTFYEKTAFSILEPTIKFFGSEKIALSTTVALEHYTATMAGFLLEHKPEVLEGIDSGTREQLHWHFTEEIEHKAVAFDVLQEIDDNYLLRIYGMILASIFLTGYLAVGTSSFLMQDKEFSIGRLIKDSLAGASTLQSLVTYTTIEVLKYFKTDFHPDQNDNYNVVDDINSLGVFASEKPDIIFKKKESGS